MNSIDLGGVISVNRPSQQVIFKVALKNMKNNYINEKITYKNCNLY